VIISVNVPDAVAEQLRLDGADGSRRALEIFAIDGFRNGELSRGQVSEMLDMELNETDGFLKENGCDGGMTVEEYEQDMAGIQKYLIR
jgi:predicted HTH domain antitoxin